MKRIISLYLLILITLFFLGCSKNIIPADPLHTVADFFEAINAGDLSEAKKLTQPKAYEELNESLNIDDSYLSTILMDMGDKVWYAVFAPEDIKNIKKIKVQVVAPDFQELFKQIVPKMQADLIKEGQSVQKLDMAVFRKELKSKLSEPAYPMIEKTFYVKVVRKKDKWLIVPDEELLNAISGNMFYVENK